MPFDDTVSKILSLGVGFSFPSKTVPVSMRVHLHLRPEFFRLNPYNETGTRPGNARATRRPQRSEHSECERVRIERSGPCVAGVLVYVHGLRKKEGRRRQVDACSLRGKPERSGPGRVRR